MLQSIVARLQVGVSGRTGPGSTHPLLPLSPHHYSYCWGPQRAVQGNSLGGREGIFRTSLLFTQLKVRLVCIYMCIYFRVQKTLLFRLIGVHDQI